MQTFAQRDDSFEFAAGCWRKKEKAKEEIITAGGGRYWFGSTRFDLHRFVLCHALESHRMNKGRSVSDSYIIQVIQMGPFRTGLVRGKFTLTPQ